jgi:Zn-dependent protease with chaperone function
MLPRDSLTALAVFVPAILPAVWWRVEVTRLLRRVEDPLFAERLLAARRRAAAVSIFSLTVIAGVMTTALWWAVPFVLVSRAAAGFGFRRRVYEETWSFPSMVWFSTRLIAAFSGFHLALVTLPLLVLANVDAHVWPVAAATAAVLVAWSYWYAPLFRFLLQTRPITEPRLAAAFDALVQRAGIRPPAFEAIDTRGGAFTNAFALPSLHRSSVVFTSPLLERLDADEIVASAAHELAHLEYYAPRRLRQYRIVQWTLIAIGTFGLRLSPSATPYWVEAAVWLLVAAFTLGWQVRKRQQNETESDRRAVALTGTPDALARGLSRINAFARLPRRWDAAFERRATHPSLARRIRDIYAAAGAAPAAMSGAAEFASATEQTRVVFEPAHLQWTTGGAEYRLPYDGLSELRVVAHRGGAAALVAADREGRRWKMPLDSADVLRIQQVLDRVDHQVAIGSAPAGPSAGGRISALTIAAVALAAGQFACALVALLCGLAVSTRLLAASAAAFATASATMYFGATRGLWSPFIVCAIAFAIFAVWSRRWRPDPRERLALAALVVATAIALLLIVSYGGTSTFRLYEASRDLSGASALLLATAAGLRTAAVRRTTRYGALLLAAGGVALAFAGLPAFVDGVVQDPLLVRAPQLAMSTIAGPPLKAIPLSFEPAEVTLSPEGDRIMLWRDEDDGIADSELQTACSGDAVADDLTCASFDGSRTRIAMFPVASAGRILPIAIVPGRFTAYAAHGSAGWLTGWRDNSLVAIHLDPLRAFEFSTARPRFASSIGAAANRIAIVETTGAETTLALYDARF